MAKRAKKAVKAKKVKQEQIYHFDLEDGMACGFSADVRAKSKVDAAKILNKTIEGRTLEEVMQLKQDDRIEDLSIYFVKVFPKDITSISGVDEGEFDAEDEDDDITEDDDERNDE